MGHDGVLASDGADALTKIQNEPFDLCLADADMPDGSRGAGSGAHAAPRPCPWWC
jgi:CheY-like chemotaxis protein